MKTWHNKKGGISSVQSNGSRYRVGTWSHALRGSLMYMMFNSIIKGYFCHLSQYNSKGVNYFLRLLCPKIMLCSPMSMGGCTALSTDMYDQYEIIQGWNLKTY